ncbi:molybdenum cofactor guanylyltransferase [Pedobacter sp. GR22-6]|uniref:molybdenum cofactor guanylyltransferase n=1 Tax=Pedobacter sp. GR22-6 TaxID=3127957 RepID=UPI00307D3447
MLGIVLCGGQSLRMGMDKGLMTYGGQFWAALAMQKLHELGIQPKCSVNVVQQVTYAGHFGAENLLSDLDALAVKGPLLGLLSAHVAYPQSDVLLLACDLLLMEKKLLGQLMDVSLRNEDAFDAYLFNNDGQQEPLCGIYRAGGLKKILSLLRENGIAKYSMKLMLNQLQVCEIPLSTDDQHCFRNFNSPEELRCL